MTYTIPFAQLGKNDILTAGGKGANLGEMTAAGFPIPPGFVLSTAAYGAFVSENRLQAQIVELASQASVDDPQSSELASAAIQKLFIAAGMPEDVRVDVLSAYAELNAQPASPVAVAVRSSATAEDLPTASFAGQQDSFLNIQGDDALLDAVKKCWASLWTARAIVYRMRQTVDPATVSLAVVVQQLVPAFQVETVDTNGCGDVFHGAYAASLVRGESIDAAIRVASAAAALKATVAGSRNGIPDRKTVDRFLTENLPD